MEVRGDEGDKTIEATTSQVMMLSPLGLGKRLWEVTGLMLLLVQMLCFFNGKLFFATYKFLPLTDMYFFADLLLRFRTGYLTDEGELVMDPQMVARRYLRGWFVVDLLLSVPYHFFFLAWEKTSALKLLDIKNSRKPILSFFTQRSFRQEVFRTIRGVLKERRFFQQMGVLPATKRSLFRRTLRLFTVSFRLSKNLKILSKVALTAKKLVSFITSLRTLSIFSRHVESTFNSTSIDEADEVQEVEKKARESEESSSTSTKEREKNITTSKQT